MSALPLHTLEDALQALLEQVEPLACVEVLPLGSALGRILAVDQFATRDVPPWDNSAMDGYALRAADAGQARPLRARCLAGDPPGVLPEGGVARIFTGAPIPAGADAVLAQEAVQGASGEPVAAGEWLRLPRDIEVGQHIRPRGQDCRRGELLLENGRRLRPQDLGLMAGQGIARLPVFHRLRVALLSTGSELFEAGREPLPAGAIYNSNRPMLAALLEMLGCEVIDLGIVRDQREATCARLEQAAGAADMILCSGGVSVGEADCVRAAVDRLGALTLWRVAIKPGKPFAFGRVRETPFIGLPGNPTSAFVTFVLLARPWIAAAQGRREGASPGYPARADFEIRRAGARGAAETSANSALPLAERGSAEPSANSVERGSAEPSANSVERGSAEPVERAEYLRVRLRSEGEALWATPYANQSSGVLRSLSCSDALARVTAGSSVAKGDVVRVYPLDGLLY